MMNDKKDQPAKTHPTQCDSGKAPEKASYGGEVGIGPGGPQPRWLRFFYLALYAFAIGYMLWHAGDQWIIRIFSLALGVGAAYSFRDLFQPRRG